MTSICRHPVLRLVLLLAAPLGCAAQRDSPDEHSVATVLTDWVPQQGRLVLGFKNPDVRVLSFAGSSHPATRVRARGELFDAAAGGTAYQGVTFNSTDGSQLRITSVVAPVAPDETWQYVVEQLRPNTTTWEPACDAPNPLVPLAVPLPDPVPSIAMQGLWLGPLYWNNASYVTLSCKSGVAAKCAGWGFPVDKQWPHVTKGGLIRWASGGDLMEACSRMARADYCALGMPNTLDGTPVQIDNVYEGVQQHNGMEFEAAWTGKAITDGAPAVNLPVVCLSKRRWSTLPLGGNCPLQVPDPRVTAKAKFCEDTDMETAGALVYSSSSYMDAGLYTYSYPATGARFTTSSVVPRGHGQPPEWKITQPPGVDTPPADPLPVFEASIFAAALPVTIPDAGVVQLFSYRCGDDLITTTSELADPPCTKLALEGHVYPRNAAGRASLRRWYSPLTKRSYTTAISPTTMAAGTWNLVETVGGVLRAAIDVNLRWSALAGYTYTIDAQTAAGDWITSCIDSAAIGTATTFAYHGVCSGNGNYALNHADILAFRVVATRPGKPTYTSEPQLYDGFSSDVYLSLSAPSSVVTAVEIRWPDLGADMVYSIDVRVSGGDWLRCADRNLLGDSTSYIHTGRCWSSGANAAVSKLAAIRLCAFARDKDAPAACSEVPYSGTLPIVDVKLKI